VAAYYYASGKRVPLEPDEGQVAVVRQSEGRRGLEASIPPESVQQHHVASGVRLVPRSKLDESSLRQLRAEGALQTVYRRGQALLVPLPEVRVEVDDERQRRAVMAAIAKAPHPVELREETENVLVLRPKSKSGDDALEIANFVFETARPAAASVRLIQFVPRPTSTKR